jgi:hypothetical protein
MDYMIRELVTCMVKKAIIVINLLPEASKASNNQIEEKIRKEAKIPLCNNIEQVSVEDNVESYMKLKKHGISDNVARNLVDLYTE